MSMSDVPNVKALPNTAQFKLKPTGVPARRTRINIQPYQSPSGAITSNQLIQFYIPARQQTLIDPQTMFLRGKISGVTTTGGNNGGILNRNAFSLFNRLQVRAQDSVLLEDIQNYNDLCHILLDSQSSRETKTALSSMYCGADEPYFLTSNQLAGAPGNTGAVQTPYTALTITNQADYGVRFANAVASDTFCIPLVSGAIGILADNLIPTGWLNSDLRLDLFTELPTIAFRYHDTANANADTVASYTLTELELVVDQISLEGESLAMMEQVAPKNAPLFLHASTFANYTTSLPNGQSHGFNTQLVPHRSLSVKQYLSATHLSTPVPGYDAFARVFPYGSSNMQICLNVGGIKMPQKAISNASEAFAELQKSMHSFNSTLHSGSISKSEYAKGQANCNTVPNSFACKSIIGLDCETWDKKSTILMGSNWTGLNVFVEGYVSNSVATSANLTAALTTQHFVSYDCIYVVQDGVISVRY